MPEIDFEGQTISCERGANLRKALIAANLPLYNGSQVPSIAAALGLAELVQLKLPEQ